MCAVNQRLPLAQVQLSEIIVSAGRTTQDP